MRALAPLSFVLLAACATQQPLPVLTPEIAQQLHLAPGAAGALVEGVEPFAPAANAGIRRGDVIVEVNREPVRSAADAVRLLRQLRPGQTAFVLVSRQGTQVFVTMRTE